MLTRATPTEEFPLPYAVNPELAVGLPGKAREAEPSRYPRRAEPDVGGLTVEDREVPGRHGAPSVPVRVYRPSRGSEPRPAVLHLHGGGFVTGGLDTDHAGAAALAEAVGAVVVSVDYRLAPEHPHPAAVVDCYAALVWLAETSDELGVDPARIAVVGRGAGGGLAAAVALLARDCGGPAPAFQALVSPALDDRLATESMRTSVDPRVGHERSWAAYLGDEAGGPFVSSYAAPARVTDLTRLPPAYVTASQFDAVRDEAQEYARRLAQANVPVELHLYPGVDLSPRTEADLAGALGRALAAPRPAENSVTSRKAGRS
ncbi:alpha/beta hydrolase [Amycolatopsis rhabdoformis]|uniref:Alpha/beta hydrolase n=1 Tax=Amycolatopsis rhabdoformis TaxID=1448059 RepID=A0ABZ1IEL6_9PSEU|nr:alpha/beta hydrolase [Amycolatopsis rhabdoformis]WSE32529.1 alpha/beta hydrolase [Amycolatopsis rhabdoformis]